MNGVPGKRFAVEVDDLSHTGRKDRFSITLLESKGYAAGGVLTKGNIIVHALKLKQR